MLNWIGKGYEILFKSSESNSTKELQKQQFIFTKKEKLIDFLNTTFEQNNNDAQLLKQSYIALEKITKSLQKQVVAQLLNTDNRIIGFILDDENDWLCPAIDSPPVPLLPVRQFYVSGEAYRSVLLLGNFWVKVFNPLAYDF